MGINEYPSAKSRALSLCDDLTVPMQASAQNAVLRPLVHSLLAAALAAGVTLAAAVQHASAEPRGRSQDQLLRKAYDSQVTGKSREYFVYLPAGYHTEVGRRWPVILFLHGGGERGNAVEDLNRVLAHGPLAEAWIQGRDLPFIIISPQMPLFDRPLRTTEALAPQRNADGPPPPRRRGRRPAQPMARITDPTVPSYAATRGNDSWRRMESEVLAIVDSTLEEFRADEDRVYLTGLSFGGAGTWHLAMADPGRWAAIAPICGPGDPSRAVRLAEAKTPVWVLQGGRDLVVRPERVLETVKALEEAGHLSVRFTVHEDLGHNAWTRVYEGWDLYAWFLTHRRPALTADSGDRYPGSGTRKWAAKRSAESRLLAVRPAPLAVLRSLPASGDYYQLGERIDCRSLQARRPSHVNRSC